MKALTSLVAAMALGMTLGIAGGLARPAVAENTACGKRECRSDSDCTKVCGSLGGQCVQVDSCNTACYCNG